MSCHNGCPCHSSDLRKPRSRILRSKFRCRRGPYITFAHWPESTASVATAVPSNTKGRKRGRKGKGVTPSMDHIQTLNRLGVSTLAREFSPQTLFNNSPMYHPSPWSGCLYAMLACDWSRKNPEYGSYHCEEWQRGHHEHAVRLVRPTPVKGALRPPLQRFRATASAPDGQPPSR